MHILIIEDEQPARDLVIKYLEEVEDVKVTQASNGFEGLKLINSTTYDVVLLDIQMPKLSGFEMLELIDNPPPVIFCTAYDEFAIKAFEQNAVDYLLKPFSKQRLLDAIAKVSTQSERVEVVEVASIVRQEPLERIVVKNAKSIDIIPVVEIQYLQSQDDYVEIHSKGKKYLKQQRLKYYESALNDKLFVRVHRQYILNINRIKKLDKMGKESYVALLKNGETIPVSASGYGRLKEVLRL
ncbi:MAG: LytTR family DNA-binding domain-containing protein [Cyclobacteriaceae bacterium]|nr:LytTR family DNA-binding domain-containing protein [Cyclobacteriaceae bacterium]